MIGKFTKLFGRGRDIEHVPFESDEYVEKFIQDNVNRDDSIEFEWWKKSVSASIKENTRKTYRLNRLHTFSVYHQHLMSSIIDSTRNQLDFFITEIADDLPYLDDYQSIYGSPTTVSDVRRQLEKQSELEVRIISRPPLNSYSSSREHELVAQLKNFNRVSVKNIVHDLDCLCKFVTSDVKRFEFREGNSVSANFNAPKTVEEYQEVFDTVWNM